MKLINLLNIGILLILITIIIILNFKLYKDSKLFNMNIIFELIYLIKYY